MSTMSLSVTTVLSSLNLLFSTSITSFIIARVIIHHVKKNGPISFASTLIKYNSIFYSFASLLICLAITRSFWTEILQPGSSMESIICSPSTSEYDLVLRYMYHFSKIYEYIDIFNVLAVGGPVNAHFGFHHFTVLLSFPSISLMPPYHHTTIHHPLFSFESPTSDTNNAQTPYLTYARTILHPTGWKVFAFLNTLHHGFMYAYFGGASLFSEVLPVTGCLQLAVGIAVELYVIWSGCAVDEALWANLLTVGLLSGYAVLFWGDLAERGREREKGREKIA
jgi:hypothetical protein